MTTVYWTPITSHTSDEDISKITATLVKKIQEENHIKFNPIVPIKVHFGEHGNQTYIPAGAYHDLISYLKSQGTASRFIETTVLYNGKRHTKELLLQTAEEHGFTEIPVISADGDFGEQFTEVSIDGHHFKSCKIGQAYQEYSQMIVCSHFKGHMLAGYGGAIKQLGMEFASKGGKLAMHMGVRPFIKQWKCHKCHLCQTRCNYNAIKIGEKSFIDKSKCTGCGACYAICPFHAISVYSLQGILNAVFQGNRFKEKLAEYALAAQKDKQIIYINFAKNITRGCDCEPHKMSPIMDDFGIFASTDAVAVDKACWDMAKEKGKTFKGKDQMIYGEKIGLGSLSYDLKELPYDKK